MRISDWSSDLCSSDLRILRATRGERAQLMDVAEHVRPRHQRVDGMRVAAAVGALDLPATRVQIADDVAAILLGADDLDLHDRLEQLDAGLLGGFTIRTKIGRAHV